MPKVGDIPCPYEMKAVFIRKKHEIAGLRAGSGNTKNIGSIIVTSPDQFGSENGPFMGFEENAEACDHYWRGYERLCKEVYVQNDLLVHREFQKFKPLLALPPT
jgi:hypothetical protein